MSRFIGRYFNAKGLKGSEDEEVLQLKQLLLHENGIEVLSLKDCCTTLLNWEEDYVAEKKIYIRKWVEVKRMKCRSHRCHKLVCKMLPKKFVSNEEAIWKKLNHPNIVSLLAVHKRGPRTTFLMEDCPKGDLLSYMHKRDATFTEEETRSLSKQLLLALAYLHRKNIVHLDVKTNNIFVKSPGYIKLGDFGHAKIFKKSWTKPCGTVNFAAPEIQTGSFSPKSDIWSVGVTIYNLLFGAYPFEDPDYRNVKLTLLRVETAGYFKPSELTREQESLFKRIFSVIPQNRPTASQFLFEDPWLNSHSGEENKEKDRKTEDYRHNINKVKGFLTADSPSLPYIHQIKTTSSPPIDIHR